MVGGGGGESQVGAWAWLEAGVSLWLTDFKLLVQGLQGIAERVGLNNLGPLLKVRLVMELSGGGGDWFWGGVMSRDAWGR